MIRIVIIALMLLAPGPLCTANAIDVGLGISSASDGRAFPALYAAIPVGKFAVSASSAGMQSEVYYESNYTLGAFYTADATDTLFGKPELGIGFGGHYSVRGLIEDPDAPNPEQTTEHDMMAGPAFRMIFRPIKHFYFGFDFVLGLGPGLLSLGLGDLGVFTLGVTI